MSQADLVALFQTGLGLSEAKAKETAKNSTLSTNLKIALDAAGAGKIEASKHGSLLYTAASKVKPQTVSHLPLLAQMIADGKLDSEIRVQAGLDHLLQNHSGASAGSVDTKSLEEACGVGIVVTPEMIEQEVEKALSRVKEELLSKRYRYNTGLLMADVRKTLKWADGKAVKSEIDVQVLDLLGPKTEADMAKPEKKAKQPKQAAQGGGDQNNKKKPVENGNKEEEDEGAASIVELMKKVSFHKPGENYKTDGYVIEDATMTRLGAHLKRTGGQVRTRFPPEPNGILHIGHAKAININFGYAAAHDGITFLRYDDTNPEKEEEKFFTAIKDMVEWLGYKPYKITHSSDNFQQLYEWAKLLINKGLAYVCHQKVEDIRGFNPPPSPWRDRPTSESLQLFEDMKNGKFDEGEATLRMKTTLEEGKQDPVAYRIKYAHHHRTGDAWCIYPTYDYTHCLCDSIEDITHSLCTKEFQARRSSYYWLCNAVEAYCPVQWEYGRLNVNYAVVSKRKIGKLISEGICADWDDPRLFTLPALRRRGFPPEAINAFVARLGLTGAQMVVDPSMLDAFVRNHLNQHAMRTMVVLDPIKVNIKSSRKGLELKDIKSSKFSVPDFPDSPEKGCHDVGFSDTIYIERADFKEKGEKGYRRLTMDQEVGLKHAGMVLKATKVVSPNEIDVEICPVSEAETKPKAFVHWVSDRTKVGIVVRLYEKLFKHKNPEDPNEVPGGFLSDVNESSFVACNALADQSILRSGKLRVFDKYQFERQGFFSVDPDSDLKNKKLVFNRTVSLKEDAGK